MSPTKSRLIPRQLSYVFYKDDDEHYTEGSAQIFVFGDRGFMYAVSGSGFFKAFVPESIEFLKKNQLRTLEGYMSKQNARSVRIAYRSFDNIEVTIGPMVNIEDHNVCWVTVELKEK